jgi:hypothetical protein
MISHHPPLVTPSPNDTYNDSYSHQDIMMNNHSQVVGLQAPAQLLNQLYVPETNQQQQIQQSHYDYTIETCDSSLMTNQQYHQQVQQQQQLEQQYLEQQALLQRANSLPPLFSSSSGGPRCVDLVRNPPYHSAPTPMAPVLPILNVDQDQYQIMMNQLFPIQTTLMHHNHGVSSTGGEDHHHHQLHHHHHVVHTNDHHHHQGVNNYSIQGAATTAGIGSLVAHY